MAVAYFKGSLALLLFLCGSFLEGNAMDDKYNKDKVAESRKPMRVINLDTLKLANSEHPYPATNAPTVYPNPHIPFVFPQNPNHKTVVYFIDNDSFGAAENLIKIDGEDPNKIAVLNMANGKNVCGGFLNGARAQEECLAGMSNLFSSLMLRGFGRFNIDRFERDIKTGNKSNYTYQNWVSDILTTKSGALYSPGITVFKKLIREKDGTMSFEDTTPFSVNVISSVAVNLGKAHQGRNLKELNPIAYDNAMNGSIETMLNVAVHTSNDVLVLGAFGCGAFDNDPTDVAQIFKNNLLGKFNGYFKKVVFAIIADHNDKKGNLQKFYDVFAK